MAIYYGEYEDCFVSEPLAEDVKHSDNSRKGADNGDETGNAGVDGYTVLNHRLRSATAGDWPEDEEDAKRQEEMNDRFGSMYGPIGYPFRRY